MFRSWNCVPSTNQHQADPLPSPLSPRPPYCHNSFLHRWPRGTPNLHSTPREKKKRERSCFLLLLLQTNDNTGGWRSRYGCWLPPPLPHSTSLTLPSSPLSSFFMLDGRHLFLGPGRERENSLYLSLPSRNALLVSFPQLLFVGRMILGIRCAQKRGV